MLEKTENKGSFIFRGCERHDTGWPKSFAKGGPAKGTLYLQKFGRAMRPKPETNKPAEFTIEQILVCAGTPWHVPESLPYLKGSYRAENHSLNDGNRDIRWASLDRRAMRFIRNVWNNSRFAIRGYWDEFAYFVTLIMAVSALSAFVVACLRIAE